MVVDIGGGTTDVRRHLSFRYCSTPGPFRVAGNEMDTPSFSTFKRKYNLLIGERTAEASKFRSVRPILDKPLTMESKAEI